MFVFDTYVPCLHQVTELLVIARDHSVEFSIFLPFSAHSLVETYLNLYRRVVVVDEGGEKSCIDGGAEALFPVRGESEATFTSPS